MVAGSSPAARRSGGAVKLPGSFISRTGQNIFTRSGLMSGVHGGYSSSGKSGRTVSDPARRRRFKSSCLPSGKTPGKTPFSVFGRSFFHSRSGRQQLPGVHEGELQASAGDQHHAGKRGRHPFSFLPAQAGFRKGKAEAKQAGAMLCGGIV